MKTQPNQMEFSFCAPEVLVLESPELATDQWVASLPDDAEVPANAVMRSRWESWWFTACTRLDKLGVIRPCELSWCLKQVGKKTLKQACKDF
jgi:hypothetical protein